VRGAPAQSLLLVAPCTGGLWLPLPLDARLSRRVSHFLPLASCFSLPVSHSKRGLVCLPPSLPVSSSLAPCLFLPRSLSLPPSLPVRTSRLHSVHAQMLRILRNKQQRSFIERARVDRSRSRTRSRPLFLTGVVSHSLCLSPTRCTHGRAVGKHVK